MQPIDEQGFVILALNTDHGDYLECARRLAASLRRWCSGTPICVITNGLVDSDEFDHVVTVDVDPARNIWSYDTQCWRLTPFRETIKLEADMLITSDIRHWWTMFRHRDLVVSTGCRDYYDRPADSRFYRQIFDVNGLPDLYNAITYWRRSHVATEFFQWVNRIFTYWPEYRTLIQQSPDTPDTDLVYAMAAVILGPELVTMPYASYPTIVHMKQHIIGTHGPRWTDELTWEFDQSKLRINTVAQWGAVHYHHKDWRP